MAAVASSSPGVLWRGTFAPASAVLALLLWGSFFVRFPLLIVCGYALGLASAFYYVTAKIAVDRAVALAGVNLLFWVVSGFLCGALTSDMLISRYYYENEGRVFIGYVPLIALSCCAAGLTLLRTTVRHVVLMAVAGLGLYLIWQAAHPAILTVGKARYFGGFITSHTGSGVFFGQLAVFLMIYGYRSQSRLCGWLGLCMLLPVTGSGSRESLVSLSVVALWFLRRAFSVKYLLYVVVAIGGLALAAPYVAPKTYERTMLLASAETFGSVYQQMSSAAAANWEPGEERNLSGEEFNILSRILYWTYAFRRFQESPLLGVGFSRFNDLHVQHTGIKGLVYFGTQGQRSAATLNAHNSYFHTLMETGLVGLVLLLSVWYTLWRRMASAKQFFAAAPEYAAYYEAVQGLIVFLLAAAMFDHALGGPIDLVIVGSLAGVGLSFFRAQRELLIGGAARRG